ncbi:MULTISPECIES: helix-turn-helix transcriptional regulator [Streptococcus]|uniref:helix-turn-helix transcriptional regulator n=1 Tax=Streptococcus TaxID=1301 RepID=UPI001933C088|nr:helix-turn-helix transcriptional regulator [Streptococcus suis]MDY3041465.1 helix-turn-helix transcriptional regulator [Streptococcus pluranimalium]MBM0272612.1 helix-turn-helix transcriptional regulator [Streptococcus suis]MCL4897875.1 helix-turn-helix transcriptional regulator [Streptococcus suis]NRH15299.1 helix-turn-helix transcriptional regulator [Streptococcus suis]HEM2805720.1 helix-turn-helix transcriptional regulator [Streptococcus suis]
MHNRLKELRKEKGLTQAELAQVINTNQSQYGKYENGKTNLSLENAKILADYFGVSIPYLLGIDNSPTLIDPGATKEILKGFAKILQGKSSIDNKITKWTPFGDELAMIIAEINQSEALADYIDFLVSKKDFNPVLVKAIKEFIADEKQGLIPFLINKSGGEDSPYHYVWQAWENSDEYKSRMAEKHK